jgi:glycosyltransferase involved in cell wall biosynthesis
MAGRLDAQGRLGPRAEYLSVRTSAMSANSSMRALILAAGRFGDSMRTRIDAGTEPRLDVFEVANALGARVIDYLDAEKSTDGPAQLVRRTLGESAAVAYLGFLERNRFDAILTTGEDIGLPLAMLLKPTRAACSHTMIAHTLFPRKKRVLIKYAGADQRVDRILAYSTSEERLMIDQLGIPARKVERIYYHADEHFFRPDDRPVEPNLICAAGQLLRDYDCLIEAVRDLDVRVQIAAGSPWIGRTLRPKSALPANVSWGRLSRYELRDLYARSALAVVPILPNEYQTGIATILEMMAMGKCVIATHTRGQTDTIVNGQTGVYVPPSDPAALRAAIVRMLNNPDEAAQIGQRARLFVEQHAGLDRFVQRIADAVRTGHELRQG